MTDDEIWAWAFFVIVAAIALVIALPKGW